MRRVANAVVVAAVVAVVAVAAWDATGREGAPADPAAGLRELGARGEILYSDERCARRRLRQPQLAVAEVPRIAGCDVFAHRGSLGVVGGEVGWYAYPGGSTMLLTRRELAREADAEGARVVAAAWLANTRYAALVERPGARQRALLLFEGDRATRLVASLEPEYRELRSSPRAGWFAALGSGGRLALFDAAGARLPAPEGADRPHAIAWSRDDALAAVADADGLLLFRAAPGGPPPVRVALHARDLAWRN